MRQNGILAFLPSPSSEELEGLVAGVDFFLGGRIYNVSNETLDELVSLGFATPNLNLGYGDGPYGDDSYGD